MRLLVKYNKIMLPTWLFHKNGCVPVGAALAAINCGDTAGAGIAAKAAPTMGLIEFMKHPG